MSWFTGSQKRIIHLKDKPRNRKTPDQPLPPPREMMLNVTRPLKDRATIRVRTYLETQNATLINLSKPKDAADLTEAIIILLGRTPLDDRSKMTYISQVSLHLGQLRALPPEVVETTSAKIQIELDQINTASQDNETEVILTRVGAIMGVLSSLHM